MKFLGKGLLLVMAISLGTLLTQTSRAQSPSPHGSCTSDTAPMSEAEAALQFEDWGKASRLFHEQMTKSSSSVIAQAGLIRAQLGEGKIADALHAATALEAAYPNDPIAEAALSETYLRRGELSMANPALAKALALDPCNARAHYLEGRLNSLLGYHASAKFQFTTAHSLAPNDAQFEVAWLFTLPPQTRYAQLKTFQDQTKFLNADDREDLRGAVLVGEARLKSSCTVSSPKSGTKIPLIVNAALSRQSSAPTFDVLINGSKRRAFLDTGLEDILLSFSVAEKLRLTPLVRFTLANLYTGGRTHYYAAQVQALRIGDVEYRNCIVRVVDEPEIAGASGQYSAVRNQTGAEIRIGAGFFSDFAFTVDAAKQQLAFTPLPPTVPEKDAEGLPLWSNVSTSGGDFVPSINGGAWGEYNRQISPEMKSWSTLVETQGLTFIPTIIGAGPPVLFELEFAAPWPRISSDVAADAQKLETLSASKAPFKGYFFEFGGLFFPVDSWTAVRTDEGSKHLKLQIAGTLGQEALRQTSFTIDSRDHLVHFVRSSSN